MASSLGWRRQVPAKVEGQLFYVLSKIALELGSVHVPPMVLYAVEDQRIAVEDLTVDVARALLTAYEFPYSRVSAALPDWTWDVAEHVCQYVEGLLQRRREREALERSWIRGDWGTNV